MLHANMTYFPVVFRKVRRLPFKHLFGKIETNLPSVFHRSCTSLYSWAAVEFDRLIARSWACVRTDRLIDWGGWWVSDSWVEILTFQIWIQWYFFSSIKDRSEMLLECVINYWAWSDIQVHHVLFNAGVHVFLSTILRKECFQGYFAG